MIAVMILVKGEERGHTEEVEGQRVGIGAGMNWAAWAWSGAETLE